MDKTALKHKIQTLEGLTNEEKSALLELLNKEKKYGLVWENKPEDVEERLRDHLPVFTEVKSRAILSDSPDAPNHILIEGDNLEALTALSYTHEGKIDVIYIDPPYNTGKEDDFRYNDKLVGPEDAYKHSQWLSFISKRLRIAKKLLKLEGVIFISIDDHEMAQLKMLCDEIFRAENFQGHIHWRRRHNQPNDKTKLIGLVAEHILCYSKNAEALKKYGVGKVGLTGAFSNPDNDPKGPWATKPWKAASGQSGSRYIIVSPNGKMFDEEWLGEETTFINLKNDGRIIFPKNGNGAPRKKYYLFERQDEGQCATNWWSHETFGSNQEATEELKNIFEGICPFKNPKPSRLIKNLINLGSINRNAIILDFFGGTGTTLHATMLLNSEDAGHRTCIIGNNNENNICTEVMYPRNKRVINGYTTPKGEQVEGLKNNSLRYYKTELLPREKSPRNMRALMAAATELLCIKEDLYEESRRFGRYRTNPKTIRYFEKGDKRMMIIFCEELADQIAEEIKTLDFGGQRLKIYIFSPDRYAFDDNFYEVQDKVQLVALPAAIYDAYRRVLPKRIDKPLLEVEAGETPTLPEATQQSIDFNFE